MVPIKELEHVQCISSRKIKTTALEPNFHSSLLTAVARPLTHSFKTFNQNTVHERFHNEPIILVQKKKKADSHMYEHLN